MNIRSLRLAAALAAVSLLAAACGGSGGDTSTTDSSETVVSDTSAPATGGGTLIYVTPNPIGTNAFLQLGKAGTEQAAAAMGGDFKVFESSDPTTIRQNVEAAIAEKPTVVIVIGFEFADVLAELAPANPDQKFLLVDQCIDSPPVNLTCAVFREYEGTFLLGAEAGLLTKSNKVGTVGALDIPFLRRYTEGFAEGAKQTNPTVTTSKTFVGGDNPFADPARGKEQALAMASDGTDMIFAAASASNSGVFDAAKSKGVFSFGVDINQCPDAPGVIVDNIEKHVDAAIVQAVADIIAGTAQQFSSYGLAEGGIVLTGLTTDVATSKCVIAEHPDVITAVADLRSQIVSGAIKLVDPLTTG